MSDWMIGYDECAGQAPQSAMERKLIVEYLAEKGLTFSDLKKLPEEEAHQIMCEACRYASLKIAEVESKASFRKKIILPE